jgi:1,4-dihydroxy-2-naphthoyl-CoA hydrolase
MSDKLADSATANGHESADQPQQPGAGALDPAGGHLSIASSPLIEAMRIRVLQASADLVIATMPVEGNTQPYGLLHGGASCVLAETLGSVGAALHGARRGMIAVGVDINATHHRGPSSGLVTGTARAIHLGSKVASYEVQIID